MESWTKALLNVNLIEEGLQEAARMKLRAWPHVCISYHLPYVFLPALKLIISCFSPLVVDWVRSRGRVRDHFRIT